jgi:quinohemoprotein ethanol dehydrogenase
MMPASGAFLMGEFPMKSGRFSLAIAGVLSAALLLSACAQEPEFGNVTEERLLAAEDDPDNWLSYGRTYAEQRFSPLADINTDNVGQLSLAYAVELDTNRGQEATPIVVDGTMYISTAWDKVLAVNAATGEVLWRYDPEVDGAKGAQACCDVVNRGVAVWEGKVFIGTLDGRLIALNAATGEELWDVVTVDQSKPYTITGAPRVVRGKVIIGNSGAELGVRGYVSAYDANSGDMAWRFYTVPGNPADGPDGAASDEIIARMTQGTWSGDWWELGGGGTVWDSIVYDPEFDQLLIGVGNGSPWNHRVRSDGVGDNLFLTSIVALDPETGRYKWHYQLNPGETWDYTATQQMTLADLTIDGQVRKVVMQAPKNGFFYVIDRSDGKLISAEEFTDQTWAERIDIATGRPVEREGSRFATEPWQITPSGLGAHAWHPMSYSPQTGLVYIPSMQVPAVYADEANFERHIGRWNTGVSFMTPPEGLVPGDTPEARRAYITAQTKGRLVAWDPVNQREVWGVDRDWPWSGGTLATGGNLVFQGTADGTFHALDARDGRELWTFQQERGIMAGPVTFRADGVQYVAVMAGYGGSMGVASQSDQMRRPAANGTLLVFRIGGTGQMPVLPPYVPAPFVTTDETFSAAQIAEGQAQFMAFCTICHSGPVNPNLMRSPVATNADAWKGVVAGGALTQRGMVSFSPWLTDAEIESIRAYVVTEAERLAAAENDK